MRKEGSDNTGSRTIAHGPLPDRAGYLFVYNLFLSLYKFGISIYALFNDKAKNWITGRHNWEQQLAAALKSGEQRIWIHSSSMGEFEQAKPIIESLKIQFPTYKILVTFFSPSGYEACKNNELADYIFYLPHDGKRNAEKFVTMVKPSMAMFVKYDFWYYYLAELSTQNVPTLLISGAFREEQPFFKWYGGIFRDMLQCFTCFFLQDEQSVKMLHTIGVKDNLVISGDTRYDRVSEIAKNVGPIVAIEHFKNGHKILIAGSTWLGDEEVLTDCLTTLPDNWKLIIVPHEVGESHIKKIQQLFGDSMLYSELDAEKTGADKKILVINNIGMLSRLFAYGDIAFIGGGFQKGGIHNILEPAVFGLPVIFGPVYQKFVEAKELASLHYVFPVNNSAECGQILQRLISDDAYRGSVSDSLKHFMTNHTGATAAIMDRIKAEKWLN
jgi:3-deoxy-D-manno-octulosonic-acid transferase